MRSLESLAAVIFSVILSGSLALGQGRFQEEIENVRYFERIENLTFLEEGSRGFKEKNPGHGRKIFFEAFNKTFLLDLESSQLYSPGAVIRWVTEDGNFQTDPEPVHYKGQLLGQPESWARFSIRDGELEGMIRTKEEIYFVTPMERDLNSGGPPSTAIYRLSDSEDLWDDSFCAMDHSVDLEDLLPDEDPETRDQGVSNAAMDRSGSMLRYDALLDHLRLEVAALTLKETEVHLVADGQYQSIHQSAAASRMADVINNMAGIYENEVGVTFTIGQTTIYTPATDPFTASVVPGELLTNFTFDEGHVNGYDLAHLFTGRDLQGGVIGIAYLGVVCHSTFATGLSQDRSSSASRTVLAAHEVGHNFDSDHDGNGNSCTSGFIMWPVLNSSATQFSSCSQDMMNAHIATRSCLADLGANQITVSSPNGGETLNAASSVTIAWETDVSGDLKIELYRNGVKVRNLKSRLPASNGSWTWSIPLNETPGSGYQVRIFSRDNPAVEDYSGTFSIDADVSLVLLSPTGGESWQAGTAHSISWSTNLTGDIRIELHRNGAKVRNLKSRLSAGNGSWTWSIPLNETPGNGYQVRILSRDDPAVEEYSGTFSMADAVPLTLLSPAGGESWQAVTAHSISWNTDLTGDIKLELFRNGVKVRNLKSRLPAGNGSWTWNIPVNETPGSGYQVRIFSRDNPSVEDYSGSFSITGGL